MKPRVIKSGPRYRIKHYSNKAIAHAVATCPNCGAPREILDTRKGAVTARQ